MRHKHGVIFIVLILAAASVLLIWGAGGSSEPDYSAFSVNPKGVGLFYDTLKRMGYAVSPGYTPINEQSPVNDVYLVVRPDAPEPDGPIIASMLTWVRRGGRLVFLENEFPTQLDILLLGSPFTEWGNLTHYTVGLGEVITGRADDITNQQLMQNSFYGRSLQRALDNWNAKHVYFAEYYHGKHASDNFFTYLPPVAKLFIYQIIIAAGVLCWRLGKRFGKAVPYYEETERGENEYVKALARLYYKTGDRMNVKKHRR